MELRISSVQDMGRVTRQGPGLVASLGQGIRGCVAFLGKLDGWVSGGGMTQLERTRRDLESPSQQTVYFG